jgi:hypothetical protein
MSKTHTAWQAVDGPSNKAKLWKNSYSTTILNILNNILPDKIKNKRHMTYGLRTGLTILYCLIEKLQFFNIYFRLILEMLS